MKALAAEMTNYFSKRLESLGITVKELTGDMQLTKGEILRTQVLHAHTHSNTWMIFIKKIQTKGNTLTIYVVYPAPPSKHSQ